MKDIDLPMEMHRYHAGREYNFFSALFKEDEKKDLKQFFKL